jgi:uncharacterized phage-associated protein
MSLVRRDLCTQSMYGEDARTVSWRGGPGAVYFIGIQCFYVQEGTMRKAILAAQDVADYFLACVDMESGDVMTPLKLQKLLYYAQGLHLAMADGEPLFAESLCAWKHGPVVKSIYLRYRRCEHRPIDPPARLHVDKYPPETSEILDAVYSNYGQFSAKKLEDMTHEEPPWRATPQSRVISSELLAEFFTTVVEAGRTGQAAGNNPVWPTKSFRFQGRKAISASMAPYRQRLGARHAERAARGGT